MCASYLHTGGVGGGHHYHHACTHLYGHRNGTKGRNNWNNRSVFGSRGWTKLGTAPLRRVRYFHHTQARWGKKMLVEHQKARNMAGASVSHIEWVHNYNFTCIPEPPFLFLSFLPPPPPPLPPPSAPQQLLSLSSLPPQDVGKYDKLLANCRNGGLRGEAFFFFFLLFILVSSSFFFFSSFFFLDARRIFSSPSMRFSVFTANKQPVSSIVGSWLRGLRRCWSNAYHNHSHQSFDWVA